MNQTATELKPKLIELHGDPRIPEGCSRFVFFHLTAKGRPRCGPSKIKLISGPQLQAKNFGDVIAYFKKQNADFVANANVRDYFNENRKTVPSDWNGRIIFPGTIFNTSTSLVMGYLSVSQGTVVGIGEVGFEYLSMETDQFAYYVSE